MPTITSIVYRSFLVGKLPLFASFGWPPQLSVFVNHGRTVERSNLIALAVNPCAAATPSPWQRCQSCTSVITRPVTAVAIVRQCYCATTDAGMHAHCTSQCGLWKMSEAFFSSNLNLPTWLNRYVCPTVWLTFQPLTSPFRNKVHFIRSWRQTQPLYHLPCNLTIQRQW